MRSESYVSGMILILLGVALLLDDLFIEVSFWELLRSLGVIGIGGLLAVRAHKTRPVDAGKMFWASFWLLLGGYFFVALFGFFEPVRGLNISFAVIFVGLAQLVKFLYQREKPGHLIWGAFWLLTGVFFLLEHLRMLPAKLLVEGVDRFWPVFLIALGIGMLVNHLRLQKRVEGQ